MTVHAGGGIEMMKSAKVNAGKSKILAVTVLTSIQGRQLGKEVIRLVKQANKAGVDGVVCSGHELVSISKIYTKKDFMKVVPGIRPTWYTEKDDQKRKMAPKEALKAGADFLVIGRPILNSKNILQTIKRLGGEKDEFYFVSISHIYAYGEVEYRRVAQYIFCTCSIEEGL